MKRRVQREDLFGDFFVEEVRETRGATIVSLGTHLPSGRRVFIKVLEPDVADDPDVVARFVHEARVLAQITSRRSLAAIDFGQTDDHGPYLVLEHIEGEDLASRLARCGPFAIPDAVLCVVQACEAVAEANDLSFVHGDLSPASLRLVLNEAAPPRVVVLDFGLTRREAFRGEAPDARTDVRGLGVTLYTLLTGDASLGRTLSSRRPDVPPGLEAIVARCASPTRDRAARFAGARELAVALSPYLGPYHSSVVR